MHKFFKNLKSLVLISPHFLCTVKGAQIVHRAQRASRAYITSKKPQLQSKCLQKAPQSLKILRFLIEASISLKMSSRCLRIFYKSLKLSLKMSSKSLKIVQNASYYWKKHSFLFKWLKKPRIFWKIPLKMYLKVSH
jgi:hypothetical protein